MKRWTVHPPKPADYERTVSQLASKSAGCGSADRRHTTTGSSWAFRLPIHIISHHKRNAEKERYDEQK
ncbi:hypothetical protein [Neorhodopirellula lusitana]|uniref:hypothetical protein n=1 Tax=Neorhodopirellula lusitana TaxID=445327 RepID=UPI00384E67AA